MERMPFGKYKGHEIASIPPGYVRWFLENVRGCHDLKLAMRANVAETEWKAPKKAKPVKTKPQGWIERRCGTVRYCEGGVGLPLPLWGDGFEVDNSDECPFDVPDDELTIEYKAIMGAA